MCDSAIATAFGLRQDDILVSIHCGSRGLGHQIGTEFLKSMVTTAHGYGIALPDRELACAPIESELGQAYLGAMRAAINCALANRQILTHLTRQVFRRLLPAAELHLLYDVSHNTCKLENHRIGGRDKTLFVHRKGATRAFGPGHPELPEDLRDVGQPVLIGGSMGTESWILAGTGDSEQLAFSSSCHGAGRAMSRRQASKRWRGRAVVDELAADGILIRSPSMRGVAEEAPRRLQECSPRGRCDRSGGALPQGGTTATTSLYQGMSMRDYRLSASEVPRHQAAVLSDRERRALRAEIGDLVRSRNAVLIAHYYVDGDIQDLALATGGHVGDSLGMARFGQQHEAPVLVIAGVRFMGESAKILSPDKRVIMPTLAADCSLDIGCPPDDFQAFCEAHPERTVVVYANTSARGQGAGGLGGHQQRRTADRRRPPCQG